MSSIAFHSEQRTVRVSGCERGHLGMLVYPPAVAALVGDGYVHPETRELVERYVPPGHYTRAARDDWRHSITTWIHVGRDGMVWNGHKIDLFRLQLNTALRIGGPSLKLAARIHAQCEVHGYVEGPNRAWLAGLIDRACADGIFRETWSKRQYDGWGAVSAMLRERNDGPVVMSYSVCESFPYGILSKMGDGEEFLGLPDAEQWVQAMAALRSRTDWEIEIKPEGFDEYEFGDGISAFDLVADDADARLAKRFGMTSAPSDRQSPTSPVGG